MKKKIIDKLYFVLLLTTIFSSSYVVLLNIAAKDGISLTNTDIELIEDTNMTDAGEISVVEIDDNSPNEVYGFIFPNSSTDKKYFLYLRNTSEIYLALNMLPPECL